LQGLFQVLHLTLCKGPQGSCNCFSLILPFPLPLPPLFRCSR
jgi:hypothetical protein